jgi:hypothetical protein
MNGNEGRNDWMRMGEMGYKWNRKEGELNERGEKRLEQNGGESLE